MSKRIYMLLAIVFSMMLAIPASFGAEKVFEGKILGLQCFQGKVDCNSDMYRYAHIAYEPDFVLVINPKKHYMLSNISRSLKQSLVGENIVIKGDLIRKGTTIDVSEIKVKTKDSTVLVWSKKIEKEKMRELNESLYGH